MRPSPLFKKFFPSVFRQVRGRSGEMLVEIIVAIALFMILISAVVPLYVGVFQNSIKDMDQFRADLYMQEGLEGLRSIRNRSFANLVDGTYGLTHVNGYWQLNGNSDTIGKFTRTVTISDISRDSSCNIVASGGSVDSHSKAVTVAISWKSGGDIAQQSSSQEYFTDWKNSAGCEQAGNLSIDLSNAALSSNNQRIINVTLKNLGPTPITIDTIRMTWTNSHLIQEVKIASTIVWKYNGGQSPSGKQSSGAELNIDNVTLQPNSGIISLDHFLFDGDMSGTTFTIYFKMTDGTIRYEQISL